MKIFIIITGYNFNIYVTIEDYEKFWFNFKKKELIFGEKKLVFLNVEADLRLWY